MNKNICEVGKVVLIGVLLVFLGLSLPIAVAQPTADSISVADASGEYDQTIQVPVNITNVANGPLQTIMFDVNYTHSVVDIIAVTTGAALPLDPITSQSVWTSTSGTNHESITLSTSNQDAALTNGSTGTIAVLWVKVVGTAGQQTDMNLINIDIANTGLEQGTIPPINGTFTVTGIPTYPTADSISVADASGEYDQTIQVPVNITNVANGPLQTIMFDVNYTHSVVDIIAVTTGAALPLDPITSQSVWTSTSGTNHESITLSTSNQDAALTNGSTGTIAVLWVKVVGTAGQQTDMNLINIDIANTGLEQGTIPSINGTFTVTGVAAGPPSITDWSPVEAEVSNIEGTSRTFKVITNQTVDVKWYINGSLVHTNTSVSAGVNATYTNLSAVEGYWNVSAIVENVNGKDMQTWMWNVTAVPQLTVTASQSTVYVGAAIGVVFTVTSNGEAVSGALVTLSDCGVSESDTTDTSGKVTISVNATSAGTITATATMTGYTENTTTITASPVPSGKRAVVLVRNDQNIGFNFIAWSGTETTTASSLATLINTTAGSEGCLPTEYSVAYYNTTLGYFKGFNVGVNQPGSEYDFTISQYDVVSVNVAKGGTFLMSVPT